MAYEEEQTERLLAFLRTGATPVPPLFNDIAEIYEVNLPIFLLDTKIFCLSKDEEIDGKVVSIDDNTFSKPVAICINTECGRHSYRGFKLSEFNSKLFVYLHEITHVVYKREIQNSLNERFERLEGRNTGLEALGSFVDLVQFGIERRINKIAHREYKKLRPYISKDKYEWKTGKKPEIELVKYDFFGV